MSTPLTRMTDKSKDFIVEKLSACSADLYIEATQVSEILSVIKDCIALDDWDSLNKFTTQTRKAVENYRRRRTINDGKAIDD